jgi:hypothetical protein
MNAIVRQFAGGCRNLALRFESLAKPTMAGEERLVAIRGVLD